MFQLFATLYLIGLSLYLLLRFVFGDGFWWLSLVNTLAPIVFLPLPFLLLYSWIRGQRWQRLLTTGLGLYALLWFGPYFWPKGEPETLSPTFTVVTYNMHALTEGLFDWLSGLEPDIVLLQEVPQDFLTTLPQDLVQRYPHQLAQAELYKGNAVLSRYPIRASEDLEGFSDYVPQRLEVEVAGRTLALYNVHLTWPIGSRRLPRGLTPGPLHFLTAYSERQRNEDLRLLESWLEREPYPFVVGGDFNLSQHSVAYERFAEVAEDSFRQHGQGWGNTWYLHPHLPPLLRIDYLWHSSELLSQDANVEPRLASDHLPLRASFAFQD